MRLVITGGTRGIGAALAARYKAHEVTAVGRRDCDVCDEAQVRELMRSKPEGVIHCAGIASMNLALLTPTESFRKILETNLLGAFIVCREAARAMIPQGGGSIVLFGSVVELIALQGEAAYTASKAGVTAMTKVLAAEWKPFNIRVNAIAPGPVKTDMIRGLPPRALACLINRLPTADYTTMEEIGLVVDRLLVGVGTGEVVYLGGFNAMAL